MNKLMGIGLIVIA